MPMSVLFQPVGGMLAARAAEPASMTVVITGISLVFLILLILIAVILIQGKIFTSLEKKKTERTEVDKPVTVAALAAQATPVPVVEEGIPSEIVAAIVAAVSAATDGAFTLRAVTTAKRGRGHWGLAGVIQSTEPF